jgi:phytoene dehydrogenase-like protein
MDATDVVVIGGGPAGLVASIRAAQGGARVCLLERSSSLGGRAGTQTEQGALLNQGPHALYLGGDAAATFAQLGVSFTGKPPTSPYFFAESGGCLYPMPTTTFGLLRSNLLGFSDKIALARALSGLGSDRALDSTPASTWIDSAVTGRARAFLSALVRVSSYAADLTLLSAGAAVRQLKRVQSKGVTYVDGGWQSLVSELERVAREHRVDLRTDAGVRRLIRQEGAWKVEMDGREPLVAHAVVLAVSPRVAHALLPDSAALAHAAEASVPIHAACLDVVLRRLPNPHHHFTLGFDRADYLSLHSAFARLAPEGAAIFHVARYLRGDEGKADDAARVRGELEGLLSRAQQGWEDNVLYTRFLPRMVVANAMPLATNAGRRAPVQVTDASGVLCCGDWVGDQGMLLDAAVASANTAGALVNRTMSPRAVA